MANKMSRFYENYGFMRRIVLCTRNWIALAGLLAVGVTGHLVGDEPATTAIGSKAREAISELVESLIRSELKTHYVDDDEWGKTRKVTRGYQVTGKPFEWDLKRRTKRVNNGPWEKYEVWLIDPQENLHVQVNRFELNDQKRLAFEVLLTAKLRGEAHWENWHQGIKGFNLAAEAEGVVQLLVAGDVGLRLISGQTLPGIAVEPILSRLDVKLLAFDLKRLSKVEGKAAHELGDTIKPTIQKELDDQEKRIVAKLNKSLVKRRDKLQFSAAEFLSSGWVDLQETLGVPPSKEK